jgi:hypothetical protein
MTKVAFRSMDERVLPEMSAKVMFLSKEEAPGKAGVAPSITVPMSSVVNRENHTIVLLVREGTVTETQVTVGEIQADRITVREGIAAGDQVVLRPDPSLTTGTRVKPHGQ